MAAWALERVDERSAEVVGGDSVCFFVGEFSYRLIVLGLLTRVDGFRIFFFQMGSRFDGMV